LFYIYSQDEESVRKILGSDIGFFHYIILDVNNEYFIGNGFPAEDNFNTILINESNEIILIGSPLLNKQMMNLYLQEFKHSGSQEVLRD
jgi:hypothetical protein